MSSIDGMPIQYLNGIDDDLDGLLGLDGPEADDQKLYDHLVNTRKSLAANPSLVKSINPASMLEMLDYAIRYWNTDKRNLALQILDNQEERLIKAKATLKGVLKEVRKPAFFLLGMFAATQLGKLVDKQVTPTVSGLLGLDGETSKLIKPVAQIATGLVV